MKSFNFILLNLGPGYATFVLIKDGQRQIFDKEIVFPWKTDAFKGKIQVYFCYYIYIFKATVLSGHLSVVEM